jgi:1-deoxy-D-xylulose-5-phosphate synthase
VVDPRWVQPVPEVLCELAAAHRLVVTVEDGGRHGGFGSALADRLVEAGIDVPVRRIALDQEFLAHDSRGAILTAAGLTDQDVARRVTEWVSGRSGESVAALPSLPRVAGDGSR